MQVKVNLLVTVFSAVQSICNFDGNFHSSNGKSTHEDIKGNREKFNGTWIDYFDLVYERSYWKMYYGNISETRPRQPIF